MSPALMNFAPQGPTMASMTPATEGARSPAISSRGSTPSESTVTATSNVVTMTKPMIVARPTSSRFLA